MKKYKWKNVQDNMKIGDVVLVKEDSINPSKWPLVKIKEVLPGKDGAVLVFQSKNITR